ncbi:hypothetical protein SS1G_06850 [Sclerotinia sclerotiorum 1980 UF-70]|uniref:Uncharacterized protein n=1 Tax=Sclerotinia sclerotiorum (strain ATCC 18683 / 1980 / Ss-1) TaxID=665079 RepID=A7ENF1_SCLS1|nr:hypothetical protein SS1G_06850 [Sclerotinia sclerotiorum 1980 UF-70]EDO04367.1 hypothetical protein SS1G_06850 [Sclerotinia sclerotiorum 1980 UF-70]
MSTVSSSLSSVITGQGNFGHFRINQFVDTNPVNATELHSKIQTPNANQVSKITLDITSTTNNSMAQSSRPTSGQNTTEITPTVAPAKTLQKDQSASSPRGGFGALELVELNSNPILDGVLGPNKDGRVRNPVPSKLKGKTDNKKGNFGVMHMAASTPGKKEAPGKDAAAERDAAARRTSENTASRAKAAANEKYAPPKKRGLDAAKNEGGNRASPFGSRDDHKQRARPLTPDETKYEQARLLTLLRSINPVTVVDQVCKAVAYFGGIPGAPPPEDGIFPESANTRETGALFIGWLAEIFPDLSSAPEPPAPKMQEPLSAKGKRGRGRPPRDSKGSENGTSDPPGPANGFGFGPAVQAPTWGLPQSVALVNTAPPMAAPPIPAAAAVPSASTASPNLSRPVQTESERPATPLKQHIDNLAPDTESTSKRRRGRPKGSRNKGKEVQTGSESAGGMSSVDASTSEPGPSEQHIQQPAAVANMTAEKPNTAKGSPIVPITDISNKGGQPQLTYSTEHWNADSSAGHTSSILPPDQYSPEERAVIEAFQNEQAPGGGSDSFNSTQPTPVNNGTPTAGGMKRKRGPNKPKNPSMTASQNISGSQPQTSHTSKNISPLPAPAESPLVQKDTSSVQWESVPPMVETLVPPPPKRQRKPKVPGANGPVTGKKTGSSVVSNATPPIPPSSIPDSPATSVQGIQQNIQQSQQGTPVTRPADGLEAHYARFQDLGQQNGRSITPTITPQMANSYRAGTMSQASPQFTHAENAYRTASPHNIAQPSPSFSQADTSYRTSSSLANPSPTYSQPEASYNPRTPSISTTTPSYSQPDYKSSALNQTSSYARSTPTTHQQQSYNQFADASYIDLPTLDLPTLGHTSASPYGQTNMNNLGGSSRSNANTNSIYGTSSGLGNAFDGGANDLLRVNRAGSGSYGAAGSAGPFDGGEEMRQRLMKGMLGRER